MSRNSLKHGRAANKVLLLEPDPMWQKILDGTSSIAEVARSIYRA